MVDVEKTVSDAVKTTEKVATETVKVVKSWSKKVWKGIGIGLVIVGTGILALAGVGTASITGIVTAVVVVVGLVVALLNA
jgi:hypothetical protein